MDKPLSKFVPWVIMHMPHASRLIPEKIRSHIVLGDSDLELELDRLTDHYTDELFDINDDRVCQLKYPVSRFVADPERYSEDSEEPMSKVGQGVIYTRTTSGDELRKAPDAKLREYILNAYYWPHHHSLEKLVKTAIVNNGFSLIIDCHSFPNKPLPVDTDQSPIRPDICIGCDNYHTPDYIKEFLVNSFEKYGYSVEINVPYAGTMVPGAYYKNINVYSVMIELNRRLYLVDEPENIQKKQHEFSMLKNNIFNIVVDLISEVQKTKGLDSSIMLIDKSN